MCSYGVGYVSIFGPVVLLARIRHDALKNLAAVGRLEVGILALDCPRAILPAAAGILWVDRLVRGRGCAGHHGASFLLAVPRDVGEVVLIHNGHHVSADLG